MLQGLLFGSPRVVSKNSETSLGCKVGFMVWSFRLNRKTLWLMLEVQVS